MAISEKVKYFIRDRLFLIYLCIFPFGQLFSFRTNFLGFIIPLHLIDIITLLLVLSIFRQKEKYPRFLKIVNGFLFLLSFSFIFSSVIFSPFELLRGLFYLLRIFVYSYFFVFVYIFISKVEKKKELLLKSLLYVSTTVGVFGIFQYIFYPDVRGLTIFGWDDHLFRLVSLFIDPGFTGIFLVFGFLIAFFLFLKTRNIKYVLILIFLLITIALTYARSGYLALFAGLFFLVLNRGDYKKITLVVISFVILLLLIPNYGSEGVRLLRTRSIYARFNSYSEAFMIFKKFPIFGVGYNNICLAKEKVAKISVNTESHSCSGFESGLLSIIVSSGVVGSLYFSYMLFSGMREVSSSVFKKAFYSCLAALLVHNLFINSIFYPWVMGYMSVLFAVSLTEHKKL